MAMDLHGILNQNEYYTNHYFTTIFEENASDTIANWRQAAKDNETATPWAAFRDTSKNYYRIREKYLQLRNEEGSRELIEDQAAEYIAALGYGEPDSINIELNDEITVPVFHEVKKTNGAPLLWVLLSVADERNDDILMGRVFGRMNAETEEFGEELAENNDDVLTKMFFAGAEAPRWIILIGINQIALIDRNKWDKKKYLQFDLEEIFSRHEETTFQALAVLLHKESLCPAEGNSLLDALDENSYKHSSSVSDSLKYALRECIELLGNEVLYDMRTRQQVNFDENPVDAGELTIECLRYMYRILFMLFIEAREELGFAPMKSDVYQKGYSLEGVRDVCESVREISAEAEDGYYIDETISSLFELIYTGYPEDPQSYKEALKIESPKFMFTIEPLKAHIFDPQYTKLINKAKLRNVTMLKIVDLMSISRPTNSRERRGRISYSALGINQMGAVYEALLSYRGFIAEEDLYEVKRAGDKFNELDVGYFVPERELDKYTEEERVRYEDYERKGKLRMYEKGTFIYRLAGREREKSASYYTPEVLTKCLVKYALKELLEDKTADEILNMTVCEPAMGSAAFLNEAISQLAEAYLDKKQEELGEQIAFDKRTAELQRVKMFIADRNVYGVDLNPIAVELAEVSLWLNTIYKGSHVPWFGTQLACGNSLIGARRQVYNALKLKKGTWYNEEPEKVPEEWVTDRYSHETKKQYKRKRSGGSYIYHFLLGDPGMASYTDKVIKELEPDNIKLIKQWQRDFCSKYSDEDIEILNKLSDLVDDLWMRTIYARQMVEINTEDSISVYGHDEGEYKEHLTIREKDKIYKKIYKSEGGENASPYARLKAAMDYWCALWFWPIDKADLLPTRQEFFMELSLILEGGISSAIKKEISVGQIEMVFDEDNVLQSLTLEGSTLANEVQSQIDGLGVVNLEQIRNLYPRLQVADDIAKQQRFMHWELEFADLFYERGGFDLVLGNPPWVKVVWNESNALSDFYPEIDVKDMKSSAVASKRKSMLAEKIIKQQYVKEACNSFSTLSYLGANENYKVLRGGQTDLFKCFLPLAWGLLNGRGVVGYVHPEGVYDEQNAGALRREIYKRLCYHFQFQNENYIFPIAHSKTFSANVYCNNKEEVGFFNINNLYSVETVDYCFENDDDELLGKKDDNGNWSKKGNHRRIIHITEDDLKLFADIYEFENHLETRLPVIHIDSLMNVIKSFGSYEKIDESSFFGSEMWHETYSVRDGIIEENNEDVSEPIGCILSGPNVGEANMYSKQPRINCSSKGDYECINLYDCKENELFVPRGKYVPKKIETYLEQVPKYDNRSFLDEYRLVFRKMLSKSSELNMKATIIPPKVGYVNSLIGYSFSDNCELCYLGGICSSVVFIYLINSTGKMNFTSNTLKLLPRLNRQYAGGIIVRALRLNALTQYYSQLWKSQYQSAFSKDNWGINDEKLRSRYDTLGEEWTTDTAIYNSYERYIMFCELDVLSAMSLGLNLEQLEDLCRINYPNLLQNDESTWYDKDGNIVFTTNKSLSGVGLDRIEWDNIISSISNDELKKKYFRCNRITIYESIWANFEKRFKR